MGGIVSNLVRKYCISNVIRVTSNITRNMVYGNIIHSVYGLGLIGKGKDEGKMLCALHNIPQPPKRVACLQ